MIKWNTHVFGNGNLCGGILLVAAVVAKVTTTTSAAAAEVPSAEAAAATEACARGPAEAGPRARPAEVTEGGARPAGRPAAA